MSGRLRRLASCALVVLAVAATSGGSSVAAGTGASPYPGAYKGTLADAFTGTEDGTTVSGTLTGDWAFTLAAAGSVSGPWGLKGSLAGTANGCSLSEPVAYDGTFSGNLSGAAAGLIMPYTLEATTVTIDCSGQITSLPAPVENGSLRIDLPLDTLVSKRSYTTQGLTFALTQSPPAPQPKPGKTANVKAVSGTVTVNGVPLTALTQIPFGAVIDTTHGVVGVTTAVGHATQTATFAQGVFRLTQVATSGLTTAALVHESSSLCQARGTSAVAGTKPAGPVKKVLQKLLANGHGRFRSKGRYGAAAAHGTEWLLEDRCDGTFVHDYTDSVVVSDYVRHKTILLHAGQSYLAARP